MTAIPCPHCSQPIDLFNTEEVAARLGLSPVTVRQRARERGIGIEVDARSRLYTAADVEAMGVQLPRGRPRREVRVWDSTEAAAADPTSALHDALRRAELRNE